MSFTLTNHIHHFFVFIIDIKNLYFFFEGPPKPEFSCPLFDPWGIFWGCAGAKKEENPLKTKAEISDLCGFDQTRVALSVFTYKSKYILVCRRAGRGSRTRLCEMSDLFLPPLSLLFRSSSQFQIGNTLLKLSPVFFNSLCTLFVCSQMLLSDQFKTSVRRLFLSFSGMSFVDCIWLAPVCSTHVSVCDRQRASVRVGREANNREATIWWTDKNSKD